MKIVLKHLTKEFPSRNKKGEIVVAVNDFDFEIPDGKLIGLLGPSGCGKSTALNLICGLEVPTRGQIFFGENDVTKLSPENRGVGMVFQNYALYPHLTVRQNIRFPLENLKGRNKLAKEVMEEKVVEAARLVQIEDYLERKPNQLSGGQQQRVAIARALMNEPPVLFADEPTGNLDTKSSVEIMNLFTELSNEGITIVMVTHEDDIAAYAKRHLLMRDGRLIRDDRAPAAPSAPPPAEGGAA